jgi:hypothetical protein
LADLAPDHLRPPRDALLGMEMVGISDALTAAIGHGKVMASGDLGVDGPGPWAVLGPEGGLLAVYERCPDGRVKPAVVLVAT